MRKILNCIGILLMSFSAMAEHHGAENADIQAAKIAFEDAYATNDVEKYFSFYADDAKVYFGGAARGEVAPYHKMWTALIAAGGGIELNKLTDLQIDVVPSGDVAVVTSFIDNRRREPNGTRVTAKAFQTDVWRKIDGKWKIISLHYSEFSAEE
jgi:ketosteroid isomerase-like protein